MQFLVASMSAEVVLMDTSGVLSQRAAAIRSLCACDLDATALTVPERVPGVISTRIIILLR